MSPLPRRAIAPCGVSPSRDLLGAGDASAWRAILGCACEKDRKGGLSQIGERASARSFRRTPLRFPACVSASNAWRARRAIGPRPWAHACALRVPLPDRRHQTRGSIPLAPAFGLRQASAGHVCQATCAAWARCARSRPILAKIGDRTIAVAANSEALQFIVPDNPAGIIIAERVDKPFRDLRHRLPHDREIRFPCRHHVGTGMKIANHRMQREKM